MEASSRQAVAAQLDKACWGHGRGQGGVWEQNPPFPVLPGPAPSAPTSPPACRTAGQWLGPAGSRRRTELSPAAPSPSPQPTPAGDGSEGAGGSSSFAVPSLCLWDWGQELLWKLLPLEEEDKKGWTCFPCISWGLCLELAKLGCFWCYPTPCSSWLCSGKSRS